MPININCQHFKLGGYCTHCAAPRRMFGYTRCVVTHPHKDPRLTGCSLMCPHTKPEGKPLGPPNTLQRLGSHRVYTIT